MARMVKAADVKKLNAVVKRLVQLGFTLHDILTIFGSNPDRIDRMFSDGDSARTIADDLVFHEARKLG